MMLPRKNQRSRWNRRQKLTTSVPNAESSEDTGAEIEPADNDNVDEQSKNADASVDAEYVEDMIGLLSY